MKSASDCQVASVHSTFECASAWLRQKPRYCDEPGWHWAVYEMALDEDPSAHVPIRGRRLFDPDGTARPSAR